MDNCLVCCLWISLMLLFPPNICSFFFLIGSLIFFSKTITFFSFKYLSFTLVKILKKNLFLTSLLLWFKTHTHHIVNDTIGSFVLSSFPCVMVGGRSQYNKKHWRKGKSVYNFQIKLKSSFLIPCTLDLF